jgi:hypothetical protein
LHDDQQPLRASDAKRAYEKPGVAWEEMLEVRKTLAVACAKVAGRSGVCTQFPTS